MLENSGEKKAIWGHCDVSNYWDMNILFIFAIFDQHHVDTNSSEEECYTQKHSLMVRKKKNNF